MSVLFAVSKEDVDVVEVAHDVVVGVVFRCDGTVMRDARFDGVRTETEAQVAVACAVEHVRDTEAAQCRDVTRVLQASHEEIRCELGGGGGRTRSRLRVEDGAHGLEEEVVVWSDDE